MSSVFRCCSLFVARWRCWTLTFRAFSHRGYKHSAQVAMEDAQPTPVTPEPSPAPSPAPSPLPSPLLDKISLPGANHVEVCCALISILNVKQSDKKSTIYLPGVSLRCVSVHTDDLLLSVDLQHLNVNQIQVVVRRCSSPNVTEETTYFLPRNPVVDAGTNTDPPVVCCPLLHRFCPCPPRGLLASLVTKGRRWNVLRSASYSPVT